VRNWKRPIFYIARDSPARAAKWRDSLAMKTQTLSEFPKRCARAPEAEACGLDIRQLLFGAYRILFLIDNGTVFVLHIRHGARQAISPAPAPDAAKPD